MTPKETHARRETVGDWELERFRLGELPGADMERLKALVASDATLRLRLDALERSSEEILDDVSARMFAATVRARLDEPTAPSVPVPRTAGLRPAWAGLAAVLAAAVALVVFLPIERPEPGSMPAESPEADVTRIKGLEPSLEIFRRTAAGSERLGDGSAAQLDDVIQIAYQAGGWRYGVIASVDGRGLITVHLPAEGAQAAALSTGKVALDVAYRLDDAPRFERFYLVTSHQPFPVAQVIDAMQAVATGGPSPRTLPLPASMRQASVEIKKVPVP